MSELTTTGARTFFGVPAAADLADVSAQVAFLGVPFDGGTPQPGNRTGQKLGLPPRAGVVGAVRVRRDAGGRRDRLV